MTSMKTNRDLIVQGKIEDNLLETQISVEIGTEQIANTVEIEEIANIVEILNEIEIELNSQMIRLVSQNKSWQELDLTHQDNLQNNSTDQVICQEEAVKRRKIMIS